MEVIRTVKAILSNCESDNPGTKGNLARISMQGRLGGNGKTVILSVDQSFEHGPARSFAPNPAAYDPQYHLRLALAAGLTRHPQGSANGSIIGRNTFQRPEAEAMAMLGKIIDLYLEA